VRGRDSSVVSKRGCEKGFGEPCSHTQGCGGTREELGSRFLNPGRLAGHPNGGKSVPVGARNPSML